MVDKEIVDAGLPRAGPYNSGIKVGNVIYVSGQVGIDPQTKKLASEEIEGQTRAVLRNIKKIIEAVGGHISDIVKTTIFLKNVKDFSKMNLVYKEFFKENGVAEKFPARTTVEVSNLPLEGLLIEIDCIVVI
ncbi:MAG: RidA family protein [Candidatus Helarchaeota archaeon]